MIGNCWLQASKGFIPCEVPCMSPSFKIIPSWLMKDLSRKRRIRLEKVRFPFPLRIDPNSWYLKSLGTLGQLQLETIKGRDLICSHSSHNERSRGFTVKFVIYFFSEWKCHSSYLPEFVAKDWGIKKTRSHDPSFQNPLQAGVEDT